MIYSPLLAVLLLASCSATPPANAPDAEPRVLDILDRVLAQPRPYRAAAIGTALGVDMAPTAASNEFFGVLRADGPAPFASVEVREPRAATRGGLILLTLETTCLTAAAVGERVGPTNGMPPSIPSPAVPTDTPRYQTHPQSWGEVRLGYAPETGCLRSIVLDAD